jgi:hypothetical protein
MTCGGSSTRLAARVPSESGDMELLMTSATSASPATTPSPPTQPSAASEPGKPAQPPVHYGGVIENIAAGEGLHPQDVAIGMTAVLAGIAGPHAGLKLPSGNVIRPSLNLVYTGSLLVRYNAFTDRLFAPVRQHARALRQDAKLASRPLSDLIAFGGDLDNIGKAPPWAPGLKGVVAKWVHDQQLIQQPGMPPFCNGSGAPAPFPGPKQLPSFFFEELPLQDIPAALAESVHREMLLLNPADAIFDERLSRRRGKDVHAGRLVALLGGVDTQFPKLHRNQGHGSFEFARVHLWSRLALKDLGQVLHDGSSPWHELPKHCLLWDLLPKCEELKAKPTADPAWHLYDQLVHELIKARCFPNNYTDSVGCVPKACLQNVRRWEQKFRSTLQDGEERLKHDVAQHRDFFATMLWALNLLHQQDEEYWCAEAACLGSLRAIRGHLDICNQARSASTEEHRARLETKLTAILQRRGPSTFREVQRVTDDCKAADLRPVFEQLTKQGRVSLDEQNRYVLIKPQASSTPSAG